MQRLTMTRTTLAMVTMLALMQSGWTQTPPASAPAATATKSSPTRLARQDEAFLKQAAENGHADVEGSKLAERKATNDKVKAFAKQMIDDHTKAGSELNALASSKGVQVPSEPSTAQKGRLKKLEAADGSQFDQRFADDLGVKAHEDTVKLFQKAAKDAKDADVKAWASKTLPTLEQHLQQARELKTAVSARK